MARNRYIYGICGIFSSDLLAHQAVEIHNVVISRQFEGVKKNTPAKASNFCGMFEPVQEHT